MNIKKGEIEQEVYQKNKSKRVNLQEMRKKTISRPTRKVMRKEQSPQKKTETISKCSQTMILSAFDKKVFYFDLGLYKKWFEFEVKETLYTFEHLAPKYPDIVIFGGSPSLMIYHLKERELMPVLFNKHLSTSKVYTIKYIQENDFVISGSSTGEIILWKYNDDKKVLIFYCFIQPSNEGRHINKVMHVNDSFSSILVANNSKNLSLFRINSISKEELLESFDDFLFSNNPDYNIKKGNKKNIIINDNEVETFKFKVTKKG